MRALIEATPQTMSRSRTGDLSTALGRVLDALEAAEVEVTKLRADAEEAHRARCAWVEEARRENDMRLFAERERAVWFLAAKRAWALVEEWKAHDALVSSSNNQPPTA